MSNSFSFCCRCDPKTELKPNVGVPMNFVAQVPLLLCVLVTSTWSSVPRARLISLIAAYTVRTTITEMTTDTADDIARALTVILADLAFSPAFKAPTLSANKIKTLFLLTKLWSKINVILFCKNHPEHWQLNFNSTR